jgi:pyruvate kinase
VRDFEPVEEPYKERHYEIVATLGPATDTEEHWQSLLEAGATGFRLNTSHLTVEQLLRTLDRLDRFLAESGSGAGVRAGTGTRARGDEAQDLFLVLDLQGSKWRLGEIPERILYVDEQVRLVRGDRPGAGGSLPVPHDDFFTAAADSPGDVHLNDAQVRLEIVSRSDEEVTAVVRESGPVSARKGISLRGSTFRTEKLGEKDDRIVRATRGSSRIRYAFSYVRDGVEMSSFRKTAGGDNTVIGKIERASALEDSLAIARAADELWLCRGDLGAELGLVEMARGAHRFAKGIPRMPARCLLAGQVLDHMTGAPRPTRSEVCHMHDALLAGYTGFVLSDETAVGRFPLESCRAAAIFRKHYS